MSARTFPPLLVAALTLTSALAACSPRGDAAPADESAPGVALPNPLAKPDFTFTDTQGQPYDFRQGTEGFVTLLFFGYTNCPDICPVTMATLSSVLGDLPQETSSRVRVVFVSTDPERDTPERIGEWLGTFDPDFVGLRGPLDEVHALEASLLLPKSMMDMGEHEEGGEETGDYQVGHASLVVVFGADGLAHRMYPGDTQRQVWETVLPGLVKDLPPAGQG